MRLIDVDKIKKPIYAEDDNCTGDGMTYDEMDAYNHGINKVWYEIKTAPTVDAVEVVRCKDCTYWDKISGGFAFWIGRCVRRDSVTGCDYFCGSAERRTDA